MSDSVENLTTAEKELAKFLKSEAKRLEELKDMERLGVPWDADMDMVRRAFFNAAAQHHPDRYVDKPIILRDLAAEVFMLYSESEQRLAWRKKGRPKPKSINSGPPRRKSRLSFADDIDETTDSAERERDPSRAVTHPVDGVPAPVPPVVADLEAPPVAPPAVPKPPPAPVVPAPVAPPTPASPPAAPARPLAGVTDAPPTAAPPSGYPMPHWASQPSNPSPAGAAGAPKAPAAGVPSLHPADDPVVEALKQAEIRASLAESEVAKLREAMAANLKLTAEVRGRAEAAEVEAQSTKIISEQNTELAAQTGQLTARLELAERQQAAFKDQVKKLTIEASRKDDHLRQIGAALEAEKLKGAAEHEVVQRVEAVQAQVQIVTAQRDEAIERAQQIHIALEAARAHSSNLAASAEKVDDLKKSLDAARAALAEREVALTEAQAKTTQQAEATRSQIETMEREVSAATQRADAAAARIADLTASEARVRAAAASGANEVQELLSQLTAARAKTVEASNLHLEAESRISQLSTRLDSADASSGDAESRVASAEQRASLLEAKLRAAELRALDAERRASELTSHVEELRAASGGPATPPALDPNITAMPEPIDDDDLEEVAAADFVEADQETTESARGSDPADEPIASRSELSAAAHAAEASVDNALGESAASAVPAPAEDIDVDELYDDALDDMVSGRAAKAVESFKKLVAIDPKNADYRSGLDLAEGYVLKEKGDTAQFSSRFEHAIDSDQTSNPID